VNWIIIKSLFAPKSEFQVSLTSYIPDGRITLFKFSSGGGAMIKEFREFALRGNVLDLAVAVIIGGAFGKIITSLVDDILMPLVGLVLGGVDFSALAFTFGGAELRWGAFVQSIVDFVIVALVIFLLVRAMNRLKREEPTTPTTKECPHCSTTIPLKATRCPNCTSQL
jgi:large conductance mechanosensitive channel